MFYLCKCLSEQMCVELKMLTFCLVIEKLMQNCMSIDCELELKLLIDYEGDWKRLMNCS